MAETRDVTTQLKPSEAAIGFDVFTVDGLPVGRVGEIAGDFMRIDAHLRPDFWLRLDDATNVEARSVTLAYPKDALAQHMHSSPQPHAGEFTPVGADPVLLDEEEQRSQRAAMERELEEQRLRMSGHAPEASQFPDATTEARRPTLRRCAPCIGAALGLVVAFVLIRRRRARRRAAVPEPPTA
jgi:hypothetical protein